MIPSTTQCKRLRVNADLRTILLERLPDFPIDDLEISGPDWTWQFVYNMKNLFRYALEYECVPISGEDVKSVFMNELLQHNLSQEKRKALVIEYNKAIGYTKFPKEWPDRIVDLINGFIDMYGDLPDVNRAFLKKSPHYPKILAALYIAGTYDKRFIFSIARFAGLLDCNQKVVHHLIKRLSDDGYGRLHVIRKGFYSSNKAQGKTSWYQLDDGDAILNLFAFTTVQRREKFRQAVTSYKRAQSSTDWGDYVITPSWLYSRFLLG